MDILPLVAAPDMPAGVTLVQVMLAAGVVELRVMAAVWLAEQMVWFAPENCTAGEGFTVMVNICTGPLQAMPPLVWVGVTVMVATIGKLPVLEATKEFMSPDPLAARPMVLLLFVQEYVVPVKADPVKAMLPTVEPVQTTWFRGLTTVGVGFTVRINVLACPTQF
jgi:hypothetical protein